MRSTGKGLRLIENGGLSSAGARLLIALLVVFIGVFAFAERDKLALSAMNSLSSLVLRTPPDKAGETLSTAIYDVAVEVLEAPVDPGQGGAIAAFGDDVYLITRLGAFHRLNAATRAFEPLALEAPEKVVTGGLFYDRPKDFASLGYKDLILRDREDGRVDALVSAARIDQSGPCVTVSVYRATLTRGDLSLADGAWREVWSSKPCIDNAPQSFPFQSGGDMTFLPDGRVAIFVGDFGIDGNSRHIDGFGPQTLDNDYGKVSVIDTDTGASEIWSWGHRNPGGITTDLDGRLWLSEHGPQGGDEINLIEKGGNYGWPLETYGVDYGTRGWSLDPTTGVQDRFIRPIYAFVPSMAMSSLAVESGDEFPAWRGDLILGTLKYQRLMRLRIREGRVIFAEPIRLTARVRDVSIDAAGRIYVKDDTRGAVYRLTNVTTQMAATGPAAVLASAGCGACHQVSETGADPGAGPTLVGVFGRRIGSVRGFRYSEALKQKRGAWDEAALRAFLTDPQGFAEGSTMPAPDISEVKAEAVIGALKGPEG